MSIKIDLPHQNVAKPAKVQVTMRRPQFTYCATWDTRRELATAAAHHFANALGLDSRSKIRVDLRAGFKHSNKNAIGYCENPEDGVTRIEIKRDLAPLSMLTIIAHEIVHASQFQTGKLENRREGGKWDTYWKGVKDEGTPYWDQPWEIEAREVADLIVADFLAHHKPAKRAVQRRLRV